MGRDTVLTVGSLFSGIGGIDLGLERAGMRVVWQSEIDPYACRVLAKHWPTVPNLGDVTTIDWSTVERPDVICGGYPCQPFSLAGARRGEDDPRHLWPHMLRALRELRPRFALLENVPGHLSLGFGRVLGDLAESGFDAEWDCIPAAAVGAPHLRDRVFIVAHAHGEGQPGLTVDAWPRPWELVPDTDSDELRVEPVAVGGCGGALVADGDGTPGSVADADPSGRSLLEGCRSLAECAGRRAAGGGGWWRTEPDVGRVAHGVPARVDRLRALGNSVVPQVAEHVGRPIVRAAA
jgi:DNA (cytosine-5)-methyltransferase 1